MWCGVLFASVLVAAAAGQNRFRYDGTPIADDVVVVSPGQQSQQQFFQPPPVFVQPQQPVVSTPQPETIFVQAPQPQPQPETIFLPAPQPQPEIVVVPAPQPQPEIVLVQAPQPQTIFAPAPQLRSPPVFMQPQPFVVPAPPAVPQPPVFQVQPPVVPQPRPQPSVFFTSRQQVSSCPDTSSDVSHTRVLYPACKCCAQKSLYF